MGYNNHNNNNRNNYGNNNGNSYGNNRGYSNQNNQRQQQPEAKRSWAVYGKLRKGQYEGLPYVNAFKITKQGLVKCSVMPYHATGIAGKEHIVESGSGKQYLKMMASVQVGLEKPSLHPVLYNIQSKIVVISDISMCITPNGSGTLRSGKRVSGYFGRNYKN